MAASTHDEEDLFSQTSGGSDTDYGSDQDPNYDILEETRGRLSSLSIKKKSISRIGKGSDAGEETVDEKSFERVQEIIAAGEIGKLKVDQCKVYLRKSGLRLSGNKETLIQRIKEHQEILNGQGEDKYPVSSFAISCKGDACTGDVVMFEQNVYEMFNIASRSAGGPPSGTRVVAGRIVKESYGAAKQQHTFTIEVLWSKGEKALPPLHPLLIKGRNLYRLTTLRQKWEDERERQKFLNEKHLRGSLARSNREIRIQEKEKRKMLRETRAVKRSESDRSQSNPTLIANMGKHAQQGSCSDLRNMILSHKAEANPMGKIGPQATCPQHPESKFINGHDKQQHIPTRNADSIKPRNYVPVEPPSLCDESGRQVLSRNSFQQRTSDSYGSYRDDRFSHFKEHLRTHRGKWEENHHREPLTSINRHRSPTHWQQPSRSVNHHPAPMGLQHRQGYQQQQLCKYYSQGRCYYGDNCKFSHEWV